MECAVRQGGIGRAWKNPACDSKQRTLFPRSRRTQVCLPGCREVSEAPRWPSPPAIAILGRMSGTRRTVPQTKGTSFFLEQRAGLDFKVKK